MFISKAWAAVESATPAAAQVKEAAAEATSAVTSAALAVPSAGESFMQTMLFTVILIVLFYILLIRPQQKRFKEHTSMLNKLATGEKIITQGGLVGVIESIKSDQEMVVDFGNNIKMTVVRSSIVGRYDDHVKTDKSQK